MAAKKAIPVRLAPEVIEKARAYAQSHDVSNQVVYESAIVKFLAAADRGDARLLEPNVKPPTPTEVERAKAQEREAYLAVQTQHLARQEKLNEAKLRASGVRS